MVIVPALENTNTFSRTFEGVADAGQSAHRVVRIVSFRKGQFNSCLISPEPCSTNDGFRTFLISVFHLVPAIKQFSLFSPYSL